MSITKSFRLSSSADYDLRMIVEQTGLNATKSVELALDVLSYLLCVRQDENYSSELLGNMAEFRLDRVLSKVNK